MWLENEFLSLHPVAALTKSSGTNPPAWPAKTRYAEADPIDLKKEHL
jgi:hypothetical protein